MKNGVWIAVSFSVLSSLASAGNTKSTTTQKTSDQIKRLNLEKRPAFENALPCVAGGAG